MRTTSAALCLALLTPAAFAQDPGKQAEERAEVQRLIEELGDDSYRVREAAEKALTERGKDVLKLLREVADEHEDPEVRWRARRLARRIEGRDGRLHEADAGESRPLPDPRSDRGRGREDFIERLERMMDRGELMLPEHFREQLRDLDERMDALHRRLGSGRFPGLDLGIDWDQLRGNSSGTNISIGPDGVRLEVKEQRDNGESDTKVYEAPDLESFREKYPEVAKQYLGDGTGLRMSWPRGFRLGNPRDVWGFEPGVPVEQTPPAAPPEGQRLGVYIGELAPAVREFLGLDSGQGLLVNEVEGASLAESLGVEAGDVICEIAGEPVFGSADVARILGGIEQGATVEVKVNRRGRDVELEAKKQHGPDERDDSKKLKKR